MTSYTDARPEDGIFVPLPSPSRRLDAVGVTDNSFKLASDETGAKSLAPYRDCLGRESTGMVRMRGPRQFR